MCDEKIIIIGYGNCLRNDDGLGPAIVDEICRQKSDSCENLNFRVIPQLDVSMAFDLSMSSLAIFVDARDDDDETLVKVAEILPPLDTGNLYHTTHTMKISDLLGITQSVYGKCPRCFAVMPKGFDFQMGTDFSEKGKMAFSQSLEKIEALLI